MNTKVKTGKDVVILGNVNGQIEERYVVIGPTGDRRNAIIG